MKRIPESIARHPGWSFYCHRGVAVFLDFDKSYQHPPGTGCPVAADGSTSTAGDSRCAVCGYFPRYHAYRDDHDFRLAQGQP